MPELAFFIGKGGVGKTTLASAFAIHQALRSRPKKVLLISTDPAHSLADVLLTKMGDSPVTIEAGKRVSLTAWELDAAKRFRIFLRTNKEQLLTAIERGSIFTRDEIASLLETSLPGMSEIAALLAIEDALRSGKHDMIVVDTAPFGHTLRLFGLPQQFLRLLRFLELAADRDQVLARHFGGRTPQAGLTFVTRWRARISSVQSALAKAQIFLVTTAEKFSLNESLRCVPELRASDPRTELAAVILNRVVTRPGGCARCRDRAEQARAAQKQLRREFPSAEFYIAEDPGLPIVGLQNLRKLADSVFLRKPLKWNLPKAASRKAQIELRPTKWPQLATPLSFVVGKGGVGKTTIAAGLGYVRWSSRVPVEICSVDPAPSLDDVFQAPIDDQPRPVLRDKGFRASELDSVKLFKAWVAEMRAEVESATSGEYSGVHVDLSYERELFSELLEIVPPGVDELLAMFRIVDLLGGGQKKIIIDMAPTGHALELLRMPDRVLVWARLLLKTLAVHRKLALAREAAVKIAEMEVRARELSRVLKDRKEAAVYTVMLPELLPDRETGRLMNALSDLKIPAEALFVNRVLVADDAGNCARCTRAREAQAETLLGLRKRFRTRKIYLIRDFGHEIVGPHGLRELTRELWQLD